MGKVTCGVHGSVCCWRCDHCPKCEGTFKRVGKGDYCPECTAWLKANGYIFSAYYSDYVKPEQDTEQGRQSRLDGLMATIQAAADRAGPAAIPRPRRAHRNDLPAPARLRPGALEFRPSACLTRWGRLWPTSG